MDSLCKKFNVPNDIRIMIEEINHKKNTYDLINEFNDKYNTMWEMKYSYYEKKYISLIDSNYDNNHLSNNKRKNILKKLRKKTLYHSDNNCYNFNLLYEPHFMVFNYTYKYIGFYYPYLLNIDNNSKYEMNYISNN